MPKHAVKEIIALNSTSQFVKDEFFHMLSSYSSLCCGTDLVKESVARFIRLRVTT